MRTCLSIHGLTKIATSSSIPNRIRGIGFLRHKRSIKAIAAAAIASAPHPLTERDPAPEWNASAQTILNVHRNDKLAASTNPDKLPSVANRAAITCNPITARSGIPHRLS